jgi:hypothetical protein
VVGHGRSLVLVVVLGCYPRIYLRKREVEAHA